MKFKDIFTKKTTVEVEETIVSESTTTKHDKEEANKGAFEKVSPKDVGKLDMVIAFDTTGSMASYIGAVRKEVSELVPRLFKENEDLKLGIVAFGDYCDMKGRNEFGDAYQCLKPTNNENEIVKFIRNTKDTSGGDGDEFYELVIKKIVEETPWREGSTRAILLIADAEPHEIGYTYQDYVVNNQIDWRKEASKAAELKIKIDTVCITNSEWYKVLSKMTNGISVPFRSGYKTVELVEAATNARGSMRGRAKFDAMYAACEDMEMKAVYKSYMSERNAFREEEYTKPRFTPERISELKPNEVFVFGSNLAGHHSGGAARMARKHFGAIMGQGVGMQGQSYAIPTMQGGVETIKPYVDEFIGFAKSHPEQIFLVTRIGCGIAGFKDEEIAPLFRKALDVDNIVLPRSFVECLK